MGKPEYSYSYSTWHAIDTRCMNEWLPDLRLTGRDWAFSLQVGVAGIFQEWKVT